MKYGNKIVFVKGDFMTDIVKELKKKSCECITKDRRKWKKKCKKCGRKSFYKNYNSYNGGKRNSGYCKKCSTNRRKDIPPMLGKHHSEKTKEKLRKLNFNKYKGKNNPFYGKKHTKKPE